MHPPYLDMNGVEIKAGDEVRIYMREENVLKQTGAGIVSGAFPDDPQGFGGTITVETGVGCHRYISPKLLEVVK